MLNFLTPKKSLNILLLTNNIFVLGAAMFPPIFALFVKEIGGNALSAGGLWATFSIVTGVLTLIISHYGDRIKETEYLLAGGYVCRAIAWLGYFFSHSLWQLFLLQLLLAVGESLGSPAYTALYSKHLDGGSYVKQWGISSSRDSIIVGIAAFLGGVIVSQFGFRFLFLVMTFLAVISFIFLIIQPRKLL